ncbi:CRAL-TRIO domain-containing protein [Aspergillus heterothallicus]
MVGISTTESAAIATFGTLCDEEGILKRPGWKEGDIRNGFTDQHTLLRFLQANNMDPPQALDQLRQATDFHTKNEALSLYDLIDVDDYEDTRRLYPAWSGRRDRRGRPILMSNILALERDPVAHWRQTRTITPARQDGAHTRYTLNMAQRALVFFDGLTRFVLPLCAAVRRQKPGNSHAADDVLKCVAVVDAATLSLKQAWDLRDFGKEISWILATCYPEAIDRVYVCNAPSYFSTLWKILKGFVEPKTAEKLVILTSAEAYTVVSEDIDHDSIPTSVGGGLAYDTGMLPTLDDELRQAVRWSLPEPGQLPPGPIKWVLGGSGEWKAIATGTVEGVARADEIGVLTLNQVDQVNGGQ